MQPPATEVTPRALRLGIPSKGRMAELTLELLDVRAAARCGAAAARYRRAPRSWV